MANNKIRFGMENVLYFLTLVMCAIYFFENMANKIMLVIFALLTVIPVILGSTPLFSILKEKKGFFTMVSNLKYSSFLFISGIFFTRLLVKKELLQFPGSVVFFSIMFSAIVIIFSFGYYILVYMYKKDEIIKKNTEALQRSSIKNIKKLIYDELTKYNCLIAIGGLMSLNKNEGSQLLKEYLEMETPGSEDSLKILYLVVPNYALKYLRKIKENLGNNDLLKQVRIITLKPFILIQGLLIWGNSSPEGKSMDIKGYLKYKTSITEDESIAESGIFVDLSRTTGCVPNELKESLKFIYELLLNQKYTHPDKYSIIQQFRNSKKKEYRYELIMKRNSMCFYCKLKECTDCPIYKLEATPNNVKEYFKSKGKQYKHGEYETFKSNI